MCVCVSCVDSAVRKGGPDDGMDLQTFCRQNERGQVPSFCQSSSQELLCDHHVHSSAATKTVWSLQVKCNGNKLEPGNRFWKWKILLFLPDKLMRSSRCWLILGVIPLPLLIKCSLHLLTLMKDRTSFRW